MNEVKELGPEALYTPCDARELDFETTGELEDIDIAVGQERAQDAVRFGIGMEDNGYNIFALGPSGVGKFTVLSQMLERQAAAQPTPFDWVYVHDFARPHKPKALSFTAGRGARFRDEIERLIEDLRIAIPAAFEGEEFRSRAERIEEQLNERQAAPLKDLKEKARQRRVMFIETPTGFAFAPMNQQNEVLSPEEFNRLSEEDRKRIETTVEALQEELQSTLRQIPAWRKETREKVKALARQVARDAVGHVIAALKLAYVDLEKVMLHLDALYEDIVEHVDDFRAPQEHGPSIPGAHPNGEFFQRYQVNVLVDHSGRTSAPVCYEDLPSHGNLIGRCEHRAVMGALVTDFTMIKPGALHAANGGYLVIDARKVLLQPYAWDTLKRTLQSREIRIESLERALGLIGAATLEPDPIPLRVKVILYGDRILYYVLSDLDPEFRDLFKVGADFEDSVERSPENHRQYARMIATLARRSSLRMIERSGVMRVIEHGARLAGDAEKLSTHLRSIGDLLREADYWAREAGRTTIASADVQRAIDKQSYRAERIRERLKEEVRRGTLLIDTQGKAVGQVNGLSVIQLGEFSFGRPSRITATTRIGEGKVLDIERETELGGPIHSKGVLILSSFLASRFARGQPLSLSASLVFEQSYGAVEGDSASLAELCALLSHLSGISIEQSLAVTGSVNQHGVVQPIGGVNEKIEGFFDACVDTGLTGKQGVVIPHRNVRHLMLRQDVVQAVRDGKFHVYAVDTVDQATELLTGQAAGEPGEDNTFPEESVNGKVARQLAEFTAARRRFAIEAGRPSKEDSHE